VLVSTPELADYFESVVRAGAPGKSAANWIQVELLRQLKDAGKEITESPLPPAELAALISKVESGEINATTGKRVFAQIFEGKKSLTEILSTESMGQISSTNEIFKLVIQSLFENLDKLDQLHGGKETVRKSLVGDVMRLSRGRANPANLLEELSSAILRHTNLAILGPMPGVDVVDVKFYGELIVESVSGTITASATVRLEPQSQAGDPTQGGQPVLNTSTNPTSGGA
jgi:Asp-tRNA(Asn)/Glu-tRNA(Gln) amidotransferase B subunit